MDIKGIQEALRLFAAERNWQQFHTPKNLAMALMVEAAELMELFQWKTPAESCASKMDKPMQVRIGEEAADVLLYLLQLADHAEIDLEFAVRDKLLKNAKKHAVPAVEAKVDTPAVKPVQTHALVDWENVQPKEVDIRLLVPGVTHVWIFHGPAQKRVADHHQSFGAALTLVPIARSGKNALDFHLSYYVGYISSRHPEARFVVISNDLGYGPMLEHANELGFAASQVGFGAVRAVVQDTKPQQSAKKSTLTKKLVPTKTVMPTGQTSSIKTSPSVPQKTAVKAAIAAKKAVLASSKAPKKAPPKKTLPAGVSTAVQKGTPGKKNAPLATDSDKAYAHVLSSLRKSTSKPRRKARLYSAVKSLLGVDSADDMRVERVVKRLIDEGHLAIDTQDAVTKAP